MINIKAVSPFLSDQCSWYRGFGPLGEMSRRRQDFKIDFTHGYKIFEWHELVKYKIVFFLRPYKKEHYEMLLLAKTMGLKVWIDYDDDFTVPNECPWFVENVPTFEWVKKSLEIADKVTVSTKSIEDSFSKVVPREYKVIQNGVDFDIMSPMLQHIENYRSQTVAWRGSETHDDDLLEIAPQFISVMNENQNWKTWFYWGYPKFISYYIEHVHTRKPTMLFLKSLAENCHNILMHPLAPTTFNNGKSNAAYLEGTMAGCMVLGRNLPEWSGLPNCWNYSNPNNFTRTLKEMLKMSEDDRIRSVKLGLDFIRENFNLTKLNNARDKIIEDLSI